MMGGEFGRMNESAPRAGGRTGGRKSLWLVWPVRYGDTQKRKRCETPAACSWLPSQWQATSSITKLSCRLQWRDYTRVEPDFSGMVRWTKTRLASLAQLLKTIIKISLAVDLCRSVALSLSLSLSVCVSLNRIPLIILLYSSVLPDIRNVWSRLAIHSYLCSSLWNHFVATLNGGMLLEIFLLLLWMAVRRWLFLWCQSPRKPQWSKW